MSRGSWKQSSQYDRNNQQQSQRPYFQQNKPARVRYPAPGSKRTYQAREQPYSLPTFTPRQAYMSSRKAVEGLDIADLFK